MIKVILFDLDGTLYNSSEVRKKFAEAAYHALAKLKKIPVDKAKTMIEETREKLKEKHGFPVPYTLTLVRFGMPVEIWHKENISYFDPRDYLSANGELRKLLQGLKKRFKLAILTNNNEVQAERILQALKVQDLFDHVFTYNSFRTMKPNPKSFQEAARVMGVAPKECLVVGDRYNVDLIPAQDLGMKIYEVKGPEGIEKLVTALLSVA
ncbi:MAG: HAD family hydrolase [candidate division WOR-3 bacterium]|nr:MAG: HAD family hydrolase [candidate division WOR-3 bacterium]